MLRRLALVANIAVAAGLVAVAPAYAERTNPLEGQPAVRHKFELRDGRFEITPTFEASISAYFKQAVSGGLKLEYHVSDSLSFGGMVFFGGGFNTGLMDQIVASLPAAGMATLPVPSQDDALTHVNTIPLHGGVGLTWTPWAGKLALFSKAFLAFDVYVSGGFGFGLTTNDYKGDDRGTTCDAKCDDGDATNDVFTDPRNDGPHNAGFNPGIQFGGGLHVYLANFVALDLYLRNYMFSDNPSGLDFNYDYKVDDSDRRFLSHLFFGVGVAFYLPPKADITK